MRVLQSEGAPKVALLDWLLPEMDGSEVCRRLRASSDQRYAYCMVTVADHSPDAIERLLEAGADDVISSSCDGHDLASRLRNARRILELQEQLMAARDALRFESTHDGATGVLNRSGLRENLHREFQRAVRFGTTLGTVLVDLDHFRLINDSFGYQAGDTVLREVAARIRNTIRGYDLVGRYGADEFLVLSPETSAKALMVQAERILGALSGSPVSCDGHEIIVTASIGVASSEERTEVDLVQAAETAMKQAKKTGRNSVEFARNFAVEQGFGPEDGVRSMRVN